MDIEYNIDPDAVFCLVYLILNFNDHIYIGPRTDFYGTEEEEKMFAKYGKHAYLREEMGNFYI